MWRRYADRSDMLNACREWSKADLGSDQNSIEMIQRQYADCLSVPLRRWVCFQALASSGIARASMKISDHLRSLVAKII
jgi:hypothetical protein